MGKIGRFFKKLWGGIKKGATKVWDFGKRVVGKVGHVLRPVADVAAKIGGAMSNLPGKAGAIGTGLAAGGATVKTITDLLPESKAKDKINEAINKGVDTGQQYIAKGADALTKINDKVQPWIKSGVDISRRIADGADRVHTMMSKSPGLRFPKLAVVESKVEPPGGRGFTRLMRTMGIDPFARMPNYQIEAIRAGNRLPSQHLTGNTWTK